MIELPVTPADMEAATAIATPRSEYAEQQGMKSWGEKELTRDQERLNRIVGHLGELKCAKYFGVELSKSFDGVDCKVFEVRARRIENGCDLPFRPVDKMRLPYVLVWFERNRMLLTIVGWLVGWECHKRAMEAKQEAGRDVWWQQAKGVWFIPPPYHGIASLEDWIGAGAPQHWAPERYR